MYKVIRAVLKIGCSSEWKLPENSLMINLKWKKYWRERKGDSGFVQKSTFKKPLKRWNIVSHIMLLY